MQQTGIHSRTEIYPVDSAIYLLNNWALTYKGNDKQSSHQLKRKAFRTNLVYLMTKKFFLSVTRFGIDFCRFSTLFCWNSNLLNKHNLYGYTFHATWLYISSLQHILILWVFSQFVVSAFSTLRRVTKTSCALKSRKKCNVSLPRPVKSIRNSICDRADFIYGDGKKLRIALISLSGYMLQVMA